MGSAYLCYLLFGVRCCTISGSVSCHFGSSHTPIGSLPSRLSSASIFLWYGGAMRYILICVLTFALIAVDPAVPSAQQEPTPTETPIPTVGSAQQEPTPTETPIPAVSFVKTPDPTTPSRSRR